MFPPERIVCLTEETVETLYLPGEQRRIAGGLDAIAAILRDWAAQPPAAAPSRASSPAR